MACRSLAAGLFVAPILLAVAGALDAATMDRFFTGEPYRPYVMGGTGGGGLSVTADLNGDGLPDLIKDNQFGSIGVRLNLGGFNFVPPVSYLVSGATPLALAAGDVTADGYPDIVWSRHFLGGGNSGEVVILTGHGDGTLTPGPILPCGAHSLALQVADISGDGHPDLVVCNWEDDDLTIYRAAPGGFTPRVDIPTGDGPQGVAVARLDGDAIPDLAVTCYFTKTINLHRGLGGGAFAPMGVIPMANTPGAITATDVDGDSDIDLVVGNSVGNGGSCSILRGHGDGTFDPATLHGTGAGTTAIQTADLDGDAIPEILVLASIGFNNNAVTVLRGSDGWGAAGMRHYSTGPNRSSMVLADVDRDGALDAVLGSVDRFTPVLVGNADGTFDTWSTAPIGLIRPSIVAIADLNNDSRSDLFGNDDTGGGSLGVSTGVRLQLPDGTFGPPILFQGIVSGARLVDFDKDGDLDAVGLGDGGVQVLLGNGDGSFTAGPSQPLSIFGANSVTIGDLDHDGWPDVVVAAGGCITSCFGGMAILLGTGGGDIAPPIAGPSFVYTGPSVLEDFNQDGNLDFVGGISSETAVVLLGRGDGTFDVGSFLSLGVNAIEAGYLNADAYPDLVIGGTVFSGSNPGVRFLMGDGHGGFATPVFTSVPGRLVGDLAIADLDGDGHQDVAWLGHGVVQVARGNGLGQFSTAVEYGSGGAVGIAVGDLNGDSRPDLALGCWDLQTIGLLYNEHPGYPTATNLSLMSAEAQPGVVRLRWYGAGAADRIARIERRTEMTGWTTLGSPAAEGRDFLRFEDRQVEPGVRYAYRLVIRTATSEEPTAEVWLDIPAEAIFALHGARPQPSGPDLRVAFSLATHGDASLELMDVNGRRIARREVGLLGPGLHVVRLAEDQRLPGGVYWIRLVQGARSATTKAVITR